MSSDALELAKLINEQYTAAQAAHFICNQIRCGTLPVNLLSPYFDKLLGMVGTLISINIGMKSHFGFSIGLSYKGRDIGVADTVSDIGIYHKLCWKCLHENANKKPQHFSLEIKVLFILRSKYDHETTVIIDLSPFFEMFTRYLLEIHGKTQKLKPETRNSQYLQVKF